MSSGEKLGGNGHDDPRIRIRTINVNPLPGMTIGEALSEAGIYLDNELFDILTGLPDFLLSTEPLTLSADQTARLHEIMRERNLGPDGLPKT